MIRTRDDVRECVIESLRDLLGGTAHLEITDQTNPIQDLELKSEDGVDYACYLTVRLEYYIPEELNPFVNDRLKKPRTVKEIVDFSCGLLKIEEPADARK